MAKKPEADSEVRGRTIRERMLLKDSRFEKALEEMKHGYGPVGDFSMAIISTGVEDKLEEAGILPKLKPPNPFDPEKEEAKHEQWWEDHPEESAAWSEANDRHRDVIRLLHLGAILGSGEFGKLIR